MRPRYNSKFLWSMKNFQTHQKSPSITFTAQFACGSIHQGNERFNGESRGKQCVFRNLSALLCEKLTTCLACRVMELSSTTNRAMNETTQYFCKSIR